MAKMKTYTLDELKDKYIGEIGTPDRDKYEQDLKEELQAYHTKEAIKRHKICATKPKFGIFII